MIFARLAVAAAKIAVEALRPHRCRIHGCAFRHHRIEVMAAHDKAVHEGLNR